jgi:hypothetical protein
MFTVRQTEEFVAWLDGLRDKRAQVRIAARLRQAEAGNLGIGSQSRARCLSYASTTGRAIASTSSAEDESSWFC